LNLLSDAVRLLEPFRPGYLGVDVERLAAAVLDSLRHVEALEESRLGEFDRGMIPRIESTVEG
jgi:hypothetical protein